MRRLKRLIGGRAGPKKARPLIEATRTEAGMGFVAVTRRPSDSRPFFLVTVGLLLTDELLDQIEVESALTGMDPVALMRDRLRVARIVPSA